MSKMIDSMKFFTAVERKFDTLDTIVIKAWAPKPSSEKMFRREAEAAGFKVGHVARLKGDAAGNVYDVIIIL